MSGTKSGGLKAAQKNKELYGEDFFKKIGSRGGQRGHTGGFASNPELARIAGAKGGKKSRRTGVTTGAGKKKEYYYNGDGIFNKDKKKIEKFKDSHREIVKPPKKSFIKKIFGGK